MFVGKVGAYPNKAPFRCSTLRENRNELTESDGKSSGDAFTRIFFFITYEWAQ
jgi:hypothetical protein